VSSPLRLLPSHDLPTRATLLIHACFVCRTAVQLGSSAAQTTVRPVVSLKPGSVLETLALTCSKEEESFLQLSLRALQERGQTLYRLYSSAGSTCILRTTH
jgi:hypothetical protein